MEKEERFEGYKIILQKRLSEKRYQHSLGVADTAAQLATLNGLDAEKAYLAGLMHDYAKEMSGEELLEIATKEHLLNDTMEVYMPDLLHGTVGAYLLRKEGIVTDEEILRAITWHTVGHQEMKPFDAVIYIADYIEPNRSFPNVENLRAIAYKNLEFGLLQCLDNTLAFLLNNGGIIHPFSVQARNAAIVRVNMMNFN